MEARVYKPPATYQQRLLGLDFDAAIGSIADDGHFYALALRGRARQLQLRTAMALKDFESAIEAYRRGGSPIAEWDYYCRSLIYRCEAALVHALQYSRVETERQADEFIEALKEIERPSMAPDVRRQIRKIRAFQDIRDGAADRAARSLLTVIGEVTWPIPPAKLDAYLLRAIAFLRMGDFEASVEEYWTASTSVSVCQSPLHRALFLGRLAATARLLRLEKEAAQRLQELQAIPCGPAARRAILRRAELLQAAEPHVNLPFGWA